MTFWIFAGLIAAGITAWITAPLGIGHRRLGLLLTALIPLFALGAYFLIGNPDLAN